MRIKHICQQARYLYSFWREGFLGARQFGYLLQNALHASGQATRSGSFPSLLVIEPTDCCQLNCPGCGYNISVAKQHSFLALADFQRIIDESRQKTICLLLYFAGEPFLHRQVSTMIKYAAEAGIAVIISTNGNFSLPDSWADELIAARCHTVIFSVSGHTQDGYARYHRNGDLRQVLNNITALQQARQRRKARLPHIVVRYLITADNAAEVTAARDFYQKLGIDSFETRLALAQLTTATSGVSAPADCNRGHGDSQKRWRNFCFWLYFAMIIKVDLNVLPCCYEFFNIPVLGNIQQAKLAEIWNSEPYRQFRDTVNRSRSNLACCRDCHSTAGFQDEAFAAEREIRLPK